MRKLDSKGFTLIELIATLVVLSIVMGLGAYSITGIIKSSKEKDYELLIKEIKNSVEVYYQECKYVDNSCDSEITLGFLVSNGYLKGNGKEVSTLINPNDNKDISNCRIGYEYDDGKVNVWAVNPSGSCPSSY